MEFKGTKGEWVATISGYKDYVRVDCENYIDKEQPILYIVNAQDDNIVWEEIKANAQLIASAPELLEMLQKICDIDNGAFELKSFSVKHLKSDIKKVINKALGK